MSAIGVSTSALCELLGCTYRQLDHWTRQGYVPASDPCPGTGFGRVYPLEAIAVAAAAWDRYLEPLPSRFSDGTPGTPVHDDPGCTGVPGVPDKNPHEEGTANCTVCGFPMTDVGDGATTHPNCGDAS